MSVMQDLDWQITRPTINERSKFMFNNDLFSDVKFVVQSKDVNTNKKQVIPAHKFVLSISSPVFEAMFYGELAETRDSIELPDCEYESLLELFRYMYSDEVNLSGSNVMGMLYLAKKYMVPSLADKCVEYLQENMDPSNVFSILPSAKKYEENNLVDQCWKVIDEQTEEAVKSDEFATIERSLLEEVVVRDTLTIEEIELFKAVDFWARKECQREGLKEDGLVKRRLLGEVVIKGIRFPTMKQEDFASVVLDTDVLAKAEIVRIIKHLNSVASSPVGFLKAKRSGASRDIKRCCRFNSWLDRGCKYSTYKGKDVISFFVDKDIVLLGVCLFGSEDNIYFVELKVKDVISYTVLASKSGQYYSEFLQGEKLDHYGFEVLFDKEAVVLQKNKMYCIEAKITGPDSTCGNNGDSTVVSSGVRFTFSNSFPSSNATTFQQGQFPDLMFSRV